MSCNFFVVAVATALSMTTLAATADTVNFGRLFQGSSAASIDTTPTFPGQIQGINMGNSAQFGLLTGNETVGGVTLLNEPTAAGAGIVVSGVPGTDRGIAGQVLPALGATSDDDALERVFNFGEFPTTGAFTVSFPVIAGEQYKVTTIFFEFISLTRTFDITIDGALGVDEFSVIQNDGLHQDALSGVSQTTFSAYEAIVTASGPSLVVGFDSGETFGQPHPLAAQDPINFGSLLIADSTPFVHGIIVERVPEPTAFLLAMAALACSVRRRDPRN